MAAVNGGSEPARPTVGQEAQSPSGPAPSGAPSISLPKGGGAIRGIGEKFAANPVTGTGSMTVPIATSPGRSGFGPELALSYDSGAGNGPFGFGWTLPVPAITRKTDKGIPRYLDQAESDEFILSGAEDLVPVYRQDPDGTWTAGHPGYRRDNDGFWVRDPAGRLVIHEDVLDGYLVRRYRPRIDGLFARIERWTAISPPVDPAAPRGVHWRSISRDNVLTLYGLDMDSRVADPADPTRVFSWLICQTRDDKGNAMLYRYKAEDGAEVDLGQAHQRNRGSRDAAARAANRYLKKILYGNRRPWLDPVTGQRPRFAPPAFGQEERWMFEVVFDYGEHDEHNPTPSDSQQDPATPGAPPAPPWRYRPDAFSTYRAGFEIRTARRCRRVLMFHHFPDEPGIRDNCLVRATDLTYTDDLDPASAPNPIYSFLRRVTHTGYRRRSAGGYHHRSLPPVEFTYTEPTISEHVEQVDPSDLVNLPIGLDGSTYRWTDLHGEGIPGILTEQADAWYYKPNLSPLPVEQPDGAEPLRARFGPLETVALRPGAALGGGAEFMDLAGDGQPDLVLMSGPAQGLYEHDDADGWLPFRPFTSVLTRDLREPNLKLVDVDGDGRADVLITEADSLVWHPSLAEDGFGPPRRVPLPLDEEHGPRVVFADGTGSIHLADLSGDGLSDIARIRNGEVCYWPNLGHGRFGAKITMDNAPRFDNPDQFDPSRIRLADIDGSGTTDIIYLHRDGVRLYFNQSGNSWSIPRALRAFPRVDDTASVTAVDLLGNGTACLVWSSSLPGDVRRPMRYVNLMGDTKPHLLIRSVNNLGAETRLTYTPSTAFYLRDKAAGRPWLTRLPFPVHVVERVETHDHISRNRFVTRYAYHHGYYDGDEREFRGFAMVEQWDTERYATLAGGALPVEDTDEASHVPPVLTKTWFHTGAHLRRGHVSDHFAGLHDADDVGEYYREPGMSDSEARALLLDDTILPDGLSAQEEREACRALKGSMLRQEVYAEDGTADATHPYIVTEQSFTIRTLQPRGGNHHAVFLTHARESISYHYERNPADPRIQHTLTLEVDAFGNVLKQAAIGYGRRKLIRAVDDQGHVLLVPNPGLAELDATDRAKQTTPLLTYTENRVTTDPQTGRDAIDRADDHRLPLPCEAITFELTGYPAHGPVIGPATTVEDRIHRHLATDLVEPDPVTRGRLRHKVTDEARYEASPTARPCRRPVEHVRTLYRRDDLTGLLPFGALHARALPGETYTLAFTPGLLTAVFQRPSSTCQSGEGLMPDPGAVLAGQERDQGGYLASQTLRDDGRFPATERPEHWWAPSGQVFYATNPQASPAVELAQARLGFFLPRRYRNPFGHDALVDFDTHNLLIVETRDALRNQVTVDANDYRTLQPRLVSDPNRNRTEVDFDALGMVVGTAVMGKPLPAPVQGDTLAGFQPDPTQAAVDGFLEAPVEAAQDPKRSQATAATRGLLAGATTRIIYDLDRFLRTRQANPTEPSTWEPACAATIAREIHVSDLATGQQSPLQVSVSYSDGFGREIQIKTQAEPGPLDPSDGSSPPLNPRWVGSGWTVFNNKGKPVRQYEPFFSQTHTFELDAIHGVSPVLLYDPADRVIATLHPNHTWEKVAFDPWRQTTWDVNDTVATFDLATGTADNLNPATDPHVGGLFQRLPNDELYLPTWYDLRTDPAKALVSWPDADPQGIALPANARQRANEKTAAERTAAHADTPTTVHLDTLGRPFLTVARNRVVCAHHALDGTEDRVTTRVDLDVEGNQRAVRDERKRPVDHLPTGQPEQRIVMRYAYDMRGNRIHQQSMEAGERWAVNDVLGQPIRTWDSRGHAVTTTYDELRRPVTQRVRGTIANGEAASDPRTLNRDILVDKTEYGEPAANASQPERDRAVRLNLRTRTYRHFDSAGVVTNALLDAHGDPIEAYDFKGNLLRTHRRLATAYKEIPDWSQNPPPQLETESFQGSARYDALNRTIQIIAPHSSLTRTQPPHAINVIQPVFNEANLLERVDVWLERAAEPTALLDPTLETPSPVGVANVDYDAKGQRLRIDHTNGASTSYTYDPLTFRLTHLVTRRNTTDFPGDDPQPPLADWPGRHLQNLHYTYDPAGNITHIHDDAQQAIYFRNQRVEPSNDYTYDAIYRLIQATGREHLGQDREPIAHSHDDDGRVGIVQPGGAGQFVPNDRNQMGRYVERYVYDAAGNFLQMHHRGSVSAHAGWTRAYDYVAPSLVEDGKCGRRLRASNRLTQTTLNPAGNTPQPETYLHDAHGNMVRMPHLGAGAPGPNMHWDYRNQLSQTDKGGGDTTFYVYEGSGQRVRKVWEKAPGLIEERIYLGAFEIFRRHHGPIGVSTAMLERETLHLMDDKQRNALVETRTLDTAGDDQAPPRLIRHQFGNHLGSVSLELDERARVISYEEYAPYGSSTYQAVRSHGETPKRYRFTGRERDEETGLAYHEARYYAPWLGRWASSDPLGLVDGANLYIYSGGNPIRFVDPHGAEKVQVDEAGTVVDDVIYTSDPVAAEVINQLTDHAMQQYQDLSTGTSFPVGAGGGVLVSLYDPELSAHIPNLIVLGGYDVQKTFRNFLILPERTLVDEEGGRLVVPASIVEIGESYDRPDVFAVVSMALDASLVVGLAGKLTKVLSANGAAPRAAAHAPTGVAPAAPALGAKRGASGAENYIPRTPDGKLIPLPQQKTRGNVDIPVPDPRAGDAAHTTLGGRVGSNGVTYRQSASFPEGGSWPQERGLSVPYGRVDWSPHSGSAPHPNPHIHPLVYNFVQREWLQLPHVRYWLPPQ